ncbi:MAG: CapA family protein [Bacteroidetes bacterium]|nr:CapA family protein [Bacteroidota bacterium]
MDQTIYNLSKCLWKTTNLLLISLFVIIAQGCKKDYPEIHILFVGDILLSRNVRAEFKIRNTSPWEDLKPLFQSADLVIGNLEGAVGKYEDQLPSNSGSPVFNVENAHISLLSEAGFKIITLENNHSCDLGEGGKEKTIEALRNCNISPVFFDNSPQFFTIKDVVIALLTLNIVLGRDFNRNEISSIEIKQKLRLASCLANIVIVSIHWGSELLEWPNREQRETAEWLVNNGADVIIGSHPHVIQKPEMIEDKPVFFSLGNHLFDQKYPGTKEGLIADISIRNGKYQCNGIITHTKANSFYPEITENRNFNLKPLSLRSSMIHINGFTLKPLSISDSCQDKIILEAFQNGGKTWRTHPVSVISITSSKLDGVNEYLFTLERHYSSLDGEISLRPYVYSADNKGLIAKWRGSALAWPLLDAVISPLDNKVLCALHRGDSFVNPDSTATQTHIAAYIWNGFGFTGINDSLICESCKKLFGK